jgi:hypothetical protein
LALRQKIKVTELSMAAEKRHRIRYQSSHWRGGGLKKSRQKHFLKIKLAPRWGYYTGWSCQYINEGKGQGLTHAQCWAHARRKVFEEKDIELEPSEQALTWIGALYAIEAQIPDAQLTGTAKHAHRQERAKPIVDRFFTWIDQQFNRRSFLPSSPFLSALAYIRERRTGLEAYLDDPDVAIDANHLERALQVIPMGRRNWLFAWTELGLKHIGIAQSMLVTCRLRDIDLYTYFVDVLQRVSLHPASLVASISPRRCGRRSMPAIHCAPICVYYMRGCIGKSEANCYTCELSR